MGEWASGRWIGRELQADGMGSADTQAAKKNPPHIHPTALA